MTTDPGALPPPILRLPAEIRREIFITLFRSTTIIPDDARYYSRHKPERGRLTALSVCRQFYLEASPLALPNVTVFCKSNTSVAETLSKMGPAQITHLRHLIVSFVPVGFPVFKKGKARGRSQEEGEWVNEEGGWLTEEGGWLTEEGDSLGEDDDDWPTEGEYLDLIDDPDEGGDGQDGDSNEHDGGQEEGGSGGDGDGDGASQERGLSEDDDSSSKEEDGSSEAGEDGEDDEHWNNGIPKHIRHFHLGAILGLFPGLQLDLLEVYCGTGGCSVTSMQNIDCLGSLLEADGYRELWMRPSDGDSEWNTSGQPCMRNWKTVFKTRFKPYGGSVRIKLRHFEWEDTNGTPWFLARCREAGFTLEMISETDDDDDDDYNEYYGHDSEDDAVVVIKRGDAADIVVKADDRQVLKCIQRDGGRAPKSFFRKASDALRKLFKENDWDSIKTMKGFDNGDLTECEGGGNAIYLAWW
jgi:hypothetical protein